MQFLKRMVYNVVIKFEEDKALCVHRVSWLCGSCCVPTIQSAAEEIAKRMADEKFSFTDAMSKFCTLCVALRKSEIVCAQHHD